MRFFSFAFIVALIIGTMLLQVECHSRQKVYIPQTFKLDSSIE